MNCSVFRKRIIDYREGCISYDLKDAMEKHIKECKACREIHLEELFIDKAISVNIKCNNIKFSSIAEDVMKNIDRTKYQKPSGNKILLRMRDHFPACAAVAAIIVISIAVAPTFFNNNNNNNNEIPLKPLSMTVEQPANNKSSSEADDIAEIQSSKGARKYDPKFEKTAYTSEPQSFTPWEISKSNKYQACIEGKGFNGTDEGIGTIIVKNIINGEKWCFQLDQNTNSRSNTPKVIKWWDDERLLVVFGYGYGNTSPGGDLYILNVETGDFTSAYELKDKTNQIIDINKSGSDLLLDMRVYDDTKWSSYHSENWVIPSFDITLNRDMEVKNSRGERINIIRGFKE